MYFIVVLLDNRQTLFVGVEGAVDIGLVKLDRFNICSLAFGCVDMSHFVVAILIAEKSDAGAL
jgi:hypothetical protein